MKTTNVPSINVGAFKNTKSIIDKVLLCIQQVPPLGSGWALCKVRTKLILEF